MQRGLLRIHFPDFTEQFPLPLPVVEFLDAFNRAAYPDLELSPL